MSFWDEMIQGVGQVAKKAATQTADEVKSAAAETANQLAPKQEKKQQTTTTRPTNVTKGRLEKQSDSKTGTMSLSADKQRRANEIASEVMEKAASEQEERDRLVAEEGLRPQVRNRTSDELEQWYEQAKQQAMAENPHALDDRDQKRKMREVDEEYERRKAELEADPQEDDGRAIVYDESLGGFVDSDKLKDVESGYISYDEDLARRKAEGEDMWEPEYGALRETADGRIMNGYAYNDIGELALADYALGNKPVDDRFLEALVNGGEEGLLQLEHRINDARDYFARQNADYKWRSSIGGYGIDHDAFAEAIADSEWLDRYRSSEKEMTSVKPVDKGSIVGSYSGGTWYTYALDDDGNRIQRTDDDGNPMFSDDGSELWEMREVGGFDGSSQFDEDGIPVPSGSYDQESDSFILDDGTAVPVTHYDDGSFAPNLFANWDVAAENPDDAIRWETYHDNLAIPTGGDEITSFDLTPAEVLEILNGTAERKSANSGFLNILAPREEYEQAISKAMDENGLLGWFSTFPEYWAPQLIDAALTTVPYVIPGFNYATVANNIGTAARGVDPSTYDWETHTFEDPGTMSMDQYIGNILGTAADVGLDYGVGAAKAVRRAMPGSAEKQIGKYLARADDGFLKNVAKDTGKTIAEESLAEGAPELFSTLDRGDWAGTYFANPLLDEDGNPRLTPAGDVMYDTETPFVDRFSNGLESVVPSATMGGALGVAVGGPANVKSARNEYLIRKAMGSYRPVDIATELTDEELAKINREAERVSYGE